ncbi:eukaryotic translation initiation factor 4 gamma 1 isoform X1 [Pelobates cultripes]|uniref:Eukaryotic translation initiation factor 4 gamma 1 isoform X1 n=1 Tax=Pelobates cultripes TaxID=61616 RepID=A0AAD1WEE3_PELCU|nr:eukaryotic translation initiation factor 4 gamma 1 isoform X1 [Pelobates cultripes]
MGNVISTIERPLVSWLAGTQPPPRNSTKKEFRKQPNIQPSTDRLPLKSEPQTFPQLSSNLDISPETEKGKRWEPREQNGGFVAKILKCCQQGTERRRLPPSVTSKFAVLDKSFRHYDTYVRYRKEEKKPDVPYYIRVTPKKSNLEIRYARPPRDLFLFSKVKPKLLPKQYKTTKKAESVNYCAECHKQDNILQPEHVTGLEDIPYRPSTDRHYNNYVRFGKEEKIPDVPYYIRVTPRETNQLMTCARPPRLPLKAEPQTFPQVSPNLEISPEPEKGKRWEPQEQNEGFVEESLKCCQKTTKRLCLPPSVTSKFAVLDKRHYNNYVRFGKEEKIPDVPYYIWVTPRETNQLMTYARPPRHYNNYVRFGKEEKIPDVPYYIRVTPRETNQLMTCARPPRHYNNYVRYGKEEKIPDVPYYIRVTPQETNQLMTYARPPRDPFLFSKVKPKLLPKQYKTTKKATNVQEKEVDKKELENEKKYSAEYCKHNIIPQPEAVTSLEDIPCHLLQARSLEPTEIITHLEDNTSLECPVSTIEPHTSGLTEELSVNLVQTQFTLGCPHEPTNLDSQNPLTALLLQSTFLEPTEVITHLEDNTSLECPVTTIEPHTSGLTEELPVNLGQPQSTLGCPCEPTNLDSQNPVTAILLQPTSLEPTEVITHLEDNTFLECPVTTIGPHTSGLIEELPVNLGQQQSTLDCQPEPMNLDSREAVKDQDPGILLVGPVCPAKSGTSEMLEELPVNLGQPQSTLDCQPEPMNLHSREAVKDQDPGILLVGPVCPAKSSTGEMLEELPVSSDIVSYHSKTTLDCPTVQPEELLLFNQKVTPEQEQTEMKNNQPGKHVCLSSDHEEQPLPEDKEKEPPGEADIVRKKSQDLPVPVLQEKKNIESKVERIHYDRESLLKFKSITQEPRDLSEIAKLYQGMLIRPHLRPVDPSRFTNRKCTPLTANFIHPAKDNYRLPCGMGQMRSPQAPSTELRKILQVSENIKPHTSEKAWKPPMKRANEDHTLAKAQELVRKVRSILNKITPQTFQHLTKQVKDLSIHTEYQLKGVVEVIFEKAVAEPHFAVVYASMCNWLMMLEVPTEDNPEESITFRRLLIRLCQKEFEKVENGNEKTEKLQKELDAATSPREKALLKDELSDACNKARRRYQGNIKFIGELFKLKFLSEDTMKDCLMKLLNRNSEESIECICILLTTTGKSLENGQCRLDNYISKIDIFIKNQKTSSRIRFLVQDMMELRKNNWVPRHTPQGPKTIEQIHKEVELESRRKEQ